MRYKVTPITREAFRAYDIRGIIGKDLDENSYYTVGRALSTHLRHLGQQDAFLARDGRLTSDSLVRALGQGLLDGGVNVIDLGAVATPVLYFATATRAINSGFMVTGSHNPAEYNGIKMVICGKTLVQEDIDLIYNRVLQGDFSSGQGQYRQEDILPEYEARIISGIHLHRPLKVVADCGNGIAGKIVPQVLEALGCQVIPLYCEVDGNFPNHHPDPTIESNLFDLKQSVLANEADIGFGFDGDADRLGVILENGEMIWPDRLLMLYAKELLKNKPGSTIVYDVKCSSHLEKIILAHQGKPMMCPTGHSIVKGIMKKEEAALAGEMSGHIFFKDRWYGFDDALYSACRLLEIVSYSAGTVSELFKDIPKSLSTPEIKVHISDEKKFQFMEKLSQTAKFPKEARINTIDGLRVEFQEGWGLVRASNTTPCLVLRFEAEDQASMEMLQQLFKEQLLNTDPNLDVAF